MFGLGYTCRGAFSRSAIITYLEAEKKKTSFNQKAIKHVI